MLLFSESRPWALIHSLLRIELCPLKLLHRHSSPQYPQKVTVFGDKHFTCMHAQSLQSCQTLCDPMDCSPPGSPVHGISQARILEWVIISFSKRVPDPGVKPTSPASPALAGRFFTPSHLGSLSNCLTTSSLMYVTCFPGINTATVANWKLPVILNLNLGLGKGMCREVSPRNPGPASAASRGSVQTWGRTPVPRASLVLLLVCLLRVSVKGREHPCRLLHPPLGRSKDSLPGPTSPWATSILTSKFTLLTSQNRTKQTEGSLQLCFKKDQQVQPPALPPSFWELRSFRGGVATPGADEASRPLGSGCTICLLPLNYPAASSTGLWSCRRS